jgi:hypothetical protein
MFEIESAAFIFNRATELKNITTPSRLLHPTRKTAEQISYEHSKDTKTSLPACDR